MREAQSRRWTVSGRVQGVGYRMFVFKNALKTGLSGYVRNMPDGTVEAVARGDEDELDSLETLIRQGPPASRVESVSVDVVDSAEEPELPHPFEIRI